MPEWKQEPADLPRFLKGWGLRRSWRIQVSIESDPISEEHLRRREEADNNQPGHYWDLRHGAGADLGVELESGSSLDGRSQGSGRKGSLRRAGGNCALGSAWIQRDSWAGGSAGL